MPLKVRDAIRILEAQGFHLKRQTGSHRQFEGIVGGLRRLVTVAGKAGDDISDATFSSIRRQSGLRRRVFRRNQG